MLFDYIIFFNAFRIQIFNRTIKPFLVWEISLFKFPYLIDGMRNYQGVLSTGHLYISSIDSTPS